MSTSSSSTTRQIRLRLGLLQRLAQGLGLADPRLWSRVRQSLLRGQARESYPSARSGFADPRPRGGTRWSYPPTGSGSPDPRTWGRARRRSTQGRARRSYSLTGSGSADPWTQGWTRFGFSDPSQHPNQFHLQSGSRTDFTTRQKFIKFFLLEPKLNSGMTRTLTPTHPTHQRYHYQVQPKGW